MKACGRFGRTPAVVALAFALLTLLPSAQASVALEEHLVLDCDVLVVADGRTDTHDGFRLDAGPGPPGKASRRVPWPSAETPTALDVSVSGSIPEDGSAYPVRIDAVVCSPGAEAARVTRTFQAGEGGTSLIDLYAIDGSRLILACTAERREVPVVRRVAATGRPVRFFVEIEWIEGERSVPVETNELNTLVGESVEYSFTFRGGRSPESMRLVLTPTRVDDDVVRVVAEVSGTLPGGDQPVIVSRRQDLVASRDVTSAVAVTTGSPPVGYRFRITPRF